MLKELEIESKKEVLNWVTHRINYDWLNSVHEGDVDRPKENACAVVIEQVLNENPNSWDALTKLGEATSEDNTTDFNLWRQSVTAEQMSVVDVLAKKFNISR